jgi:subtilisin family serine protease
MEMNRKRLLLALLLAASAFAQDLVPGRFIVELSGVPALGQRDATLRRSQIRRDHQTLERTLRQRQITVRATIDTVANALIVQAASASDLAGLPGVRAVYPVERLEKHLYRALPNHHVEEAWDLAGGIEKAGAGIKIAILDTGIDPDHPGFQAPDLAVPEGYPLASNEFNLALTNNKIIVARTFDGPPNENSTVRDEEGHGTAVAMTAAGVRHDSPRGPISGVAPAAWLGVYRVSDVDGLIYSDVALEALDAAVKDGMDVINMSFGSIGKTGAANNLFAGAIDRITHQGVILVNSAGNSAGPMMVDDRASNPRVLAAGSNNSGSAAQTSVIPSVGPSMTAAASSNVVYHDPIQAPLFDITAYDPSGLGCDPFPEGSLTGFIPLIRRGSCNFSVKLANAALAGAPGAIVYNSPEADNPEALIAMDAGNAPTIPALFVSFTNGIKLKDLAQSEEDFQVQLRFPLRSEAPDQVSSFSSSGPSVDLAIKPDLLATGSPVYTAAVTAEYNKNTCPVCDPSGYISTAGTSFSSPLIAGAAAVVKSARPGLAWEDYASLLVNNASPMILANGSVAPVQQAGAGLLNVQKAVSSNITVTPLSLSFGGAGSTIDSIKWFTVKNLGTEPASWTLSIASTDEVKPTLMAESVTLDPGATADLNIALAAEGLQPGAYQGFVLIKDDATGAEARVAYWYAVQSSQPARISIVQSPSTELFAGQTFNLLLRVHDQSGLALSSPAPTLVPVSGGGTVNSVRSVFNTYPNVYSVSLTLSRIRGTNTFRAQAGDALLTFAITTVN